MLMDVPVRPRIEETHRVGFKFTLLPKRLTDFMDSSRNLHSHLLGKRRLYSDKEKNSDHVRDFSSV
jgi:hypothetical protein